MYSRHGAPRLWKKPCIRNFRGRIRRTSSPTRGALAFSQAIRVTAKPNGNFNGTRFGLRDFFINAAPHEECLSAPSVVIAFCCVDGDFDRTLGLVRAMAYEYTLLTSVEYGDPIEYLSSGKLISRLAFGLYVFFHDYNLRFLVVCHFTPVHPCQQVACLLYFQNNVPYPIYVFHRRDDNILPVIELLGANIVISVREIRCLKPFFI